MNLLKFISAFLFVCISTFCVVQAKPISSISKNPEYKISIIHGPYVHGISETEATVVWVTDKPAISWVEIAPEDGTHFYAKERPKYYNAPIGRKVIGTFHQVKVEGLKPNTVYNYRAFSRRVVEEIPGQRGLTYYGAYVGTRVYKVEPLKFKTLDSTKKEISFSVVNDIHQKSEFLANLLKHTPKNTDFLILNGDMVHSMESIEQVFNSYLGVITEFTKNGLPMFMIRGNHEARGFISNDFMKFFPTTTGAPYFTFRAGPAMFVVIDGGEDKPDQGIEYSDRANFDTYREKQAQWLKKVIETPEYKNAPVKILITHIPPVGGGWHGAIHFQKCFADILNKAGFSLIVSGHYHVYKFIKPDNKIKIPNIVNSAKEMMNVKVNEKEITLSFVGEDGKKSRADVIVPVAK